MHLTELQDENPDHVFIVRGINRLGFRSQELLEAHCSKAGIVSRVMVAHSKVKPYQGSGMMRTRIRPGSLGFVVMDSARSVERILAAGSEQTVAGCRIRVERFQQTAKQPSAADAEDSNSPDSHSDWRRWAQLLDERGQALSEDSEAGPAAAAGGTPSPPLGREDPQLSAAAVAAAAAAYSASATLEEAMRVAHATDVSQMAHLAGTLTRLLSIIAHMDNMNAFTGQQCAEAVATTQLVREQLLSFVDRCKQRLGSINRHAATAPNFPWLPLPTETMTTDLPSNDASNLLNMLATRITIEPSSLPTVANTAAAVALAEAAALQLRLVREDLHRQHLEKGYAARVSQWPWALGVPSFGPTWPEISASTRWAPPGIMPDAVFNSDSLPLHFPAPTIAAAAAASPAASATAASSSNFADAFGHQQHGDVLGQGDARSVGSSSLAPLPERLAKKQTLGMHLTELQGEDPECVFIVRRISSMGFQSQECLASHYSQFGKVSRVLVAHSKVKPFRNTGAQPRIRPGSLGFIIMASAKSVKCILAGGKEQTVAGCCISVEPFEQIAKPREGGRCVSVSADSTSTATGDTRGSDPRSESNGSGSAGSTGSEQGSDKSGERSRQKAHSRAKAEGGSTDSQPGEGSESGSGSEALSPGAAEAGQ